MIHYPRLKHFGFSAENVIYYSSISETIAFEVVPMKQFKIVVEKHPDTYLAYPLGLKGVVVGQGETYEAALADVKSAIQFHIETFGPETLEIDPPILEAFIAEAGVSV
jgi:predicted RNase H-like HicB family nuclease